MKVGLVLPYSINRGGGVQEYVFGLQTELKRRGHEAKIITPLPRNYDGKPLKDVVFLGGSTDFKSPFHTTAQVSVTVNPERVEQVLAQEQFDVLHFHEPWVPVIGRQILAKSNVPNVATFHAKLPDTFMSRTIERVITPYTKSIMKYLDILTAVSPPAASFVTQMTKKQLTIIPNGIDLNWFTPKEHKVHKKPVITYVGRLEKRKGVKYLLLALHELHKTMPDVRLKIGGDGVDRVFLEEFVDEYEITNVEFLGYVDNKQKLKLMQDADIFCSPALYGESFGIVLLEALACGTPTVGGANPGYEFVLNGRGAIGLVNPKDTADFARRLKLLISDDDLRQAWKDWAQDYIKQFDFPHIVDSYEKLYKQAIKTSKSKKVT